MKKGCLYDFTFLEADTIYGVLRRDADPTYENQRIQTQQLYDLCGGPFYGIGDITHVRAMSKPERDFSKSEDVVKSMKAMAFIVKSSLAKIIGNLYMGLTGAAVPTKAFTDLEDARQWIASRKAIDANPAQNS